MPAPRVLAFAGSLRRGSWNKKLLRVAAEHLRAAGVETTELGLEEFQLPIFDQDYEDAAGLPEHARRLKQLFLSHQGLLLACPEYNSSITAVLKNTIDWVSRPAPGEAALACYEGKVALLLSASPGALGGLRGLVTVRSILSSIKVLVLPDQYALSRAHEAFDDQGRLRDAKADQAVQGACAALARTLGRLHP
jgi:NAD(P)H-dependent FMN reductase